MDKIKLIIFDKDLNPMEQQKVKALFIDLDHTIIETKSGNSFPKDKDDWKFKKGILGKMYDYYKNGYVIYIVTNQGGIDDGYVTVQEFMDKLNLIIATIREYLNDCRGDAIAYNDKDLFPAVQYRVGLHKGSKYRKPNASWIDEELFIDKKESLMVGDASGLVREKNIPKDSGIENTDGFKDFCNIFIYKVHDRMRDNERAEFKYENQIYGLYFENHQAKRIVKLEKDFSDSDKVFAENAGIKYVDIEEFLK